MSSFDVICFSHVRWDFVYQRPQHLLSHYALERRVFYVEEPLFVGPVARIDEKVLPRRQNVHYLGARLYTDLPAYLATWDVALLPFAINETTRFISPIQTPEYLAAGKPVVSTLISDVVQPYGEQGFVAIAETVGDFITLIEQALQEHDRSRVQRVDAFLAHISWDITWKKMSQMIESVVANQENWQPYTIASAPMRGDNELTLVGGLE